jgi:hypothetical protein
MNRLLLAGLAVVCGVTSAQALPTEALLDTLQHTAFNYFWVEANSSNGMIKDRSTPSSPCSIASLGFGLSAICVGIDHGWVSRTDGGNRVLTSLQTLWTKPQGSGLSGTIGYKGLYYHFLDMNTALRTWDCELSTIDSALLLAGVIDTKQYFSTADPMDVQIRALADSIYYRANWEFVRNNSAGIYMGWKPGTQFSGYGLWRGYNEAMILYILALGSPTHPVPASCWTYWVDGYRYVWQTYYGYTYIPFAPLFGHQYSHCWVDFKHIQDALMVQRGITYWENSRRATLAQRAYCTANPWGWTGYSANLWGLTAGDDPVSGYIARGAPPAQNDNGTISPTAPASSIPFAPGAVIPTLHNMYDNWPQIWGPYGFKDAFNPSRNWVDTDYIGIDQGPIVIMIENYRTGRVWNRFMQNPDVQTGLQRAGFVPAPNVAVGPIADPDVCALFQNSPNPVHGSATIAYRLAAEGPVRLALYDVRGRRVRQIVDTTQGAGDHQATLDAAGLPSGVYCYRLEYEGRQLTRQCLVVR